MRLLAALLASLEEIETELACDAAVSSGGKGQEVDARFLVLSAERRALVGALEVGKIRVPTALGLTQCSAPWSLASVFALSDKEGKDEDSEDDSVENRSTVGEATRESEGKVPTPREDRVLNAAKDQLIAARDTRVCVGRRLLPLRSLFPSGAPDYPELPKLVSKGTPLAL